MTQNVVQKLKDVETVSATNTIDTLLTKTPQNNSENSSISKESSDSFNSSKNAKCCSYCGLITGIFLTTIGILMLIWTPFHIFMEQRLNMYPGLPPFEWWKNPPDEVLLKVYIFNVTNAEAFLRGDDEKINMEEIGPIIYMEQLRHFNTTHNPNSTLSYVTKRTAVYLPELNTIDMNATLIVPNYATLGMASYLHDASFLTKFGFNLLLRSVNSPIFLNTTIYNFLWNLTDPMLSVARHIAPETVDSTNIGMLQKIYKGFQDTSTVFIGSKYGHKNFFLLDKYHGSKYLYGHGDTCEELLVNGTEGAIYPQYVERNMTFKYWRKTLCRIIPLYYEEDFFMDKYNLLAYKFKIHGDAYDRKSNLSQDCHKGTPVLPSGLSDVSKCYNGVPMAASFPHYLFGGEDIQSYVTGLTPNITAHDSYTYVEPFTGIPMESVARSQSNMVVKDMSGFNSDFQRFNNTVLPMFWLEYNQQGLPYYVKDMINFTVNILPKYQYPFIGLLLFIGVILLVVYSKKMIENNKNTFQIQQFEKETFLKQTIVNK